MKKLLFAILAALVMPVITIAQQAGSLDPTFNQTGIVILKEDNATLFNQVKIQPDGKIVVVGHTNTSTIAARFNPDGSFDTDFGSNGIYKNQDFYVNGIDFHLLPSGKILIVGDEKYGNTINLIQLLPNGVQDPDFGTNGVIKTTHTALEIVTSSLMQPDGKMLIAGNYTNSNFELSGYIARLLPDGSLDATFGVDGIAKVGVPNENTPIYIEGAGLQPDGKIVIPGLYGNSVAVAQWFVARYDANGVLDPTFDGDGVTLKDMGTTHWEWPQEVLILDDGSIIAGGASPKSPGAHFTLLKYQPNGAVDLGFGLGGKAQVSVKCCFSYIHDIVEQVDGKIVVCGHATDDGFYNYFAVARFKPNGIVDQTFGTGGKVTFEFVHDSMNQEAWAVAMQPDGKILSAGNLLDKVSGFVQKGVLVRLNPGAPVSSTDSPYDQIFQTLVSPNPVSGDKFQLSYTLPEPANVSVSLFDMLGKMVSVPMSAAGRLAGENTEQIELPENLPAGSYLLKINTPFGSQMVKIMKSPR